MASFELSAEEQEANAADAEDERSVNDADESEGLESAENGEEENEVGHASLARLLHQEWSQDIVDLSNDQSAGAENKPALPDLAGGEEVDGGGYPDERGADHGDDGAHSQHRSPEQCGDSDDAEDDHCQKCLAECGAEDAKGNGAGNFPNALKNLLLFVMPQRDDLSGVAHDILAVVEDEEHHK